MGLGERRLLAAVATASVLVLGACTSSASGAHDPARPSESPSSSRVESHAAAAAATSAAASAMVRQLVNPARKDRYGRVLQVRIPARGGFRPRPAYLYVPRVLTTHPDRAVPVLELLHGTPGQPSDWLVRGNLVSTLDAFAAAHHGVAPLVVVPDLNGSWRADSECIRTTSGQDVESYLAGDVVSWVRHRYPRAVGGRRWWVAGLSEGGLCAADLALRHPGTYSAFGDMSGLARPIIDHMTQAQSDQILFRGSVTARLEHDPIWLLAHRHYTNLPAWFVCGAADVQVRQAQTALVAAARAAHLRVAAGLRPGHHTWTIWAPALRDLLPWLWSHAPH